MQLFTSSIGRKILMAITGLLLVLFVVIHLIGNTTIFGWIPGGVNAYAHHLHAFPPMVWAFRAVMLIIALVHIYYGAQLTFENINCRQQKYAVKVAKKATFASENMIWTGVLLLLFILFHLAHFTIKAVPGMVLVKDAEGVVDVFAMIAGAFKNLGVTGIYVAAMVVLGLHLSHGIQSIFQTFGVANDKTLPNIVKAGIVVAVVLSIGYITVPASILLNILK